VRQHRDLAHSKT